jgi:hypothetical protein
MNADLNIAIQKLEREIQYLHVDYKRMLNQYQTFYDLKALRQKIKHAEESLRLKRKILHTMAG